MTPLLNYALNIAPGTAPVNSLWGAVVVPEAQAYNVPNGVVPPNLSWGSFFGSGPPIPGPIYRAITELSFVVEWAAGISGGRMAYYVLRGDGNWHLSSVAALTLPATAGIAFGTISSGVGLGAGGLTASAYTPCFGAALGIYGVGLAGANINYLEISAFAREIEPGMLFGTQLGALIT